MTELHSFLQDYLEEYDFSQVVELDRLKEKHGSHGMGQGERRHTAFKEMADLFWSESYPKVKDLKIQAGVHNSIAYSTIIRSFMNEKYQEFLRNFWLRNLSKEELAAKYRINERYIEDIILVARINLEQYQNPNSYCPCASSQFIIYRNHKTSEFFLICRDCKDVHHTTETLISKDLADSFIEAEKKLDKDFSNHLKDAEDQIEDKYCPNCQVDSLSINDISYDNYTYKIICNQCRHSWDYLDKFLDDHKQFQQRAAMMIKIKDKEKEYLEEKLASKDDSDEDSNLDQLIIKKEQLIDKEEYLKVINYLFKRRKDLGSVWTELYKNIKKCNQVEAKLLQAILDEFNEREYKNSTWSIKSDEISLEIADIYYDKTDVDDPLIIHLYKKTGLLNIRKILRGLMAKNLIACSEEENILSILPVLLDNQDQILKNFEPQDIANEIKFLVYSRNNFSCYNCGSDDKLLKIAYLTLDHDKNNLNSMVPVCNTCYSDVTENQVLIDGTAVFAVQDDNNEDKTSISWEFLKSYIPEFVVEEYATYCHRDHLENYDEEKMIKAYARTIFNLTEKQDGIKNVGGFFSYSKTILEEDNDIYINKWMKENCNLDYWLERLAA
ncbi:hypothetical protein I0Q91_14105 [Halanaerobiaceae bacterium Z-7014]|uniref:Uncharacterized protein n=1 Tax=Halonatronomonas betaini TaxID=2778430 RepID=A0A931AWQ2_9FIRM|nr:hypothetical protein [Halonatronomonas betaini]MBF8438210.1 hypothetical protein [Halonatronomonas betaini]